MMKWTKKSVERIENKSKLVTGRMKPMSTGYVNNLKLNNKSIYIYRVMVNGKIRTGSTGERVLFKAEKRLIDIISDYQKLSFGTLKHKAPTFSKAIEIYEANKKGMVTDQYIKNNVNLLKLHFVPKIGTMFVDKLDKQALKTCLQGYLAITQAGKVVKNLGGYNQLVTILHSFFNEMKECKYITSTEDLIPEYESSQKKVRRFIEEEKIVDFLTVIDTKYGIYKSVAVRMGLFLGLRSIEVVKAKWGMINWTDKKFTNWDTKGKEAEQIPICDEMLEWFQKLKTERIKIKFDDYIILDTDSKPAIRAFTRYAMQIGGKEVLGHYLSSHDMRRTFIMTLYKNGVELDTIRQLARHKNIKTTLEYIQTNEKDKVSAINDVFNKKKIG